MTRTAWFVAKFPLPLTAISLGRFVTVPSDPPRNFFDPTERLAAKPIPEQDRSDIYDISHYVHKSNGTKLELMLTSFASAFFEIKNASFQDLAACQAVRYFILNIDDWFDRVCQEEVFQLWLEREHMRKRTVYLVAEYCTLLKPSTRDGKKFDISVGSSVQVPVAAGMAGIPLPTPLDPSISAQVNSSREQQHSYRVDDEKVFWVGYHKVKISRKREGQAEYTLAEKRTWTELCSMRDANTDSFEISADLEEANSAAGYAQVDIEDQVFLFDQSEN